MHQLGQMCLIAFDRAGTLDLLSLRRALQIVAPTSKIGIERRPSSRMETALLVEIDDEIFVVHVAPGRIPEADYESAVRGNLLWLDAADRMARHAGFAAICGAERHGAQGMVREQAAGLTRLSAAVSEAMSGCGAHWAGTGKMTAPERLAAAVDELKAGRPPVDVWIGYRLRESEGGAGAETLGAVPFVGAEIELPPVKGGDRVEPLRRLFGALDALVTYPDVIGDNMILEVKRPKPARYRLDFADGQGGERAHLVPVD